MLGSLTLDTANMKSGIEVTLSAHSATGGDVSLKLTGGRELELVMGVPLREQRIISLSSTISTIHMGTQDIVRTPIDLDINK